ncbi:low molecular weight protein-tyrosine-phosphatase [Cereibacter johrii]|uniref:low molecular weight protein-tyrosine-phosphatase n=1 Tax=Cereibacter johrii TaxID=445629 RepID=UPI002B2575CA|nr:low molecular weight protein-tyrosine-phosphatase [Cereibacter johrii]MEA5160502.1 low molecular weight protein-tyrosine-phosphatase [Cereibacter johrii]
MSLLPSVLFVCLGNICRSPLAEAAFRAAADECGLRLTIDSAGLGGWHAGEAPDPRAQEVARANGIDISHYRARQVVRKDFSLFDHVVALDLDNLVALRELRPQSARARLSLLLDHVPGREGQAVSDPYYSGPEGFLTTWSDVTAGADGLLTKILAPA